MSTLIIIPTYNEIENVELVYKGIKKYSPHSSVLFVDDGSQDGTVEKLDYIAKNDTNVYILKRGKKLGLASAYMEGFKWGLERNFDYLQQMDCDLSHDPKYLPLFETEKDLYSLIIGSRYIEQGGVKKWSVHRRFISYSGTLYARIILGLKIKDLTGGFNCWHNNVLRAMNLDSLITKGFSFQVGLKYLAVKKGYRVKEIPYLYKDREKNISKMPKRFLFDDLIKVLWFRFLK